MVEIDPINDIRYRLRIKDAPESTTLSDSEISSRLKLEEGKHHLVLVVEKTLKTPGPSAALGEHPNYERLFNSQRAVAYLTLTLEPQLSLGAPATGEWYNSLDGYTIDLGDIDVKKGHKSLSVIGDIGEDAHKKHGLARRNTDTDSVSGLNVIEVRVEFGLDVMARNG